jgi:hypothetical protein
MEEMQDPVFDPTADWMQKTLYDHPDRDISLYDICIPRSHDAGMYILQNCTIGANACNVQTQDQDMRAQLMDGIRNFDIRPLYKNTVFFTRHSQGCDGPGCYGVRVDVMLQQLRDFLEDHDELVILEFGFWCYTDGNDPNFRQMLSDVLGEHLYRETEVDQTPFIHRPLAEIIPPGRKKGIAIALVSGVTDSEANRGEGIFSPTFIPRSGSFANAQNFPDMKADQFAKYRNFANDGLSLFEIAWTLTQDVDQALSCVIPVNPASIQSLAQMANPVLGESIDELIASDDIRKGRIPNVISVDFSAAFVTEQCIRITGINLD